MYTTTFSALSVKPVCYDHFEFRLYERLTLGIFFYSIIMLTYSNNACVIGRNVCKKENVVQILLKNGKKNSETNLYMYNNEL